jgi:hypothetical protein
MFYRRRNDEYADERGAEHERAGIIDVPAGTIGTTRLGRRW